MDVDECYTRAYSALAALHTYMASTVTAIWCPPPQKNVKLHWKIAVYDHHKVVRCFLSRELLRLSIDPHSLALPESWVSDSVSIWISFFARFIDLLVCLLTQATVGRGAIRPRGPMAFRFKGDGHVQMLRIDSADRVHLRCPAPARGAASPASAPAKFSDGSVSSCSGHASRVHRSTANVCADRDQAGCRLIHVEL